MRFTMLASMLLLIFTGCATTTLQTKAVMTRTIVVEPVKKSEMTLYLRVRNSAASKINLEPMLKKELKKRGVTLVDDPKSARYLLNVNVLFADNLREAQAIKSAATSGVNTALVAGIANHSAKDGIIAGAAAALVGGIIGKATEDEIYRAVIDVDVKERSDTIVRKVHKESESTPTLSTSQRAGVTNEFSGGFKKVGEPSNIEDGINSSDSYSYKSNYIEHKTRVLVSAVKMNLNLKKAIPILEQKASYAIAQIF